MAFDAKLIGRTHLVVSGVVDRESARQIDVQLRNGMWDTTTGVVIDMTKVDEVSGALIGALMRASRQLAWRNRQLTIVCAQPELRRRLQIAGLDEMAEISPPFGNPV